MEIKNTIKISAPISPYDTEDKFPTHESKYGKGGNKSVTTVEERNNIPTERRELGMIVYVDNDKKWYSLQNGIENNNWVDFSTVIMDGVQICNIIVNTIEPPNPTKDTIWLHPLTGSLKFRNVENTEWKSLTVSEFDGGTF